MATRADPIDAALSAALEAEEPAPNLTVQVTVGPDRRVGMVVPTDLKAIEMLALVGYITTGLPKTIAEAGRSRTRPRIWRPGS